MKYQIWGPDGLPIHQRPVALSSIPRIAAKFVLTYVHQGYYRDSRMRQLSLVQLAELLEVREAGTGKPVTEADELETTKSVIAKSEADGGVDWVKIGEVGVDSAKLLLTDPDYVATQWKGNGVMNRTGDIYEHKDGTKWVCAMHWDKIPEGCKVFDHFRSIIDEYGVCMNDLRASGDVKMLDAPKPSGEYSLAGCSEATRTADQAGQLCYKTGEPGAGVVFSAGFGDGVYPVYARYSDEGDLGVRVAEVKVVMIEEVPAPLRAVCRATNTYDDEWEEAEGPTTGVGEEYWYVHDSGKSVYVCVDQGHISVGLGEWNAN